MTGATRQSFASRTATVGRPTRFAVIGIGRIGSQHAAAIASSSRVALSAIVDPNPQALASVASSHVATFDDLDGLLGATEIDAAVVAAPSALHVELVTRLLDAGIAVLCEKPCGLRSADVLGLGELSARTGVALQIGYWRRFVPALSQLQSRIAAGELGEIAMLIAAQWDGEPPSDEFRNPASSGGIVIDMGVHDLDMVRWLTGQEITDLRGFASEVTWGEPLPGDPETVNLVIRLSGGASAVVSLARRHPPGDLCRLDVLGGDHAVALSYLQPATADAVMREALRAQAEGLAATIVGDRCVGATVADAAAALVAAERAGALLAPAAIESATL